MNITFKKMRKTAMRQAVDEKIYYVSQKSYEKNVFTIQMCGITYPDKSYEIVRQNSPIICIEYVESGSGTVHAGDETFYPESGDAYILHSNENHHYKSDPKNPWKKSFINIRGSLPESLLEGFHLKNIHHFKNTNVKDEFKKIISIAKSGKEECTEEIICLINRILFKMSLHVNSEQIKPDIAEKMKDYLSSHATQKFQIDDLCRHISRSESQTIRIFKKAYGITPYAYVLSKKINLAKDMLINTNLSIKQIAYTLNFTDEYYFSNVFKTKTGISPSAYRKSN